MVLGTLRLTGAKSYVSLFHDETTKIPKINHKAKEIILER